MAVRRFTIAIVVLTLVLSFRPFQAGAQDASPGATAGSPPDLAAMALTPEDVPAGYYDDAGEWWVPAPAFETLVLGDEAPPAGLERVYQSFYVNPDGGSVIHNYLFEFASPADAASGFAIIDPALRPPLPDGEIVGPTHTEGPAFGDGPSQLTLVSYDTRAEGGPLADLVAVSFARDRIIAGVSLERYTASSVSDATPTTAIAPDDPGLELVNQLASALDSRITTVLSGASPAAVDPSLSNIVLPLDQLVDDQTPVLGGYKSGIDLLRCGACGEENSLQQFAGDALGGVARIVSLGPLVDGEPQPPFVSVALASFSSPESAQAVLDAIRAAPNDRPTPGPIPRGNRTLVDGPVIPGATSALAFQASLDTEDPEAPLDSAGVDFVTGNYLVSIDVQGGLPPETALAAAIDFATQQATCLTNAACETVSLPPSLQSTSTDG